MDLDRVHSNAEAFDPCARRAQLLAQRSPARLAPSSQEHDLALVNPQVARREGRSDVTALPFGINTPSLLVYVFFVMKPAYDRNLHTLGTQQDYAFTKGKKQPRPVTAGSDW